MYSLVYIVYSIEYSICIIRENETEFVEENLVDIQERFLKTPGPIKISIY